MSVNNISKLVLFAGITLLISSCATKISERASKIQVHQQMTTLVSNCKNLGPVSSPSTEWAPTLRPDMVITNATNNARDAVAEMGGDTLVITNTDLYNGDMVGKSSKAVALGIAMKCY